MGKRKKAKVKPELQPRLPVDLKAEEVRGADGWRHFEGLSVRRPVRYNPSMRTHVPTVVGVIVAAFRREPGGRVFLEIRMDRDSGAGGTAVIGADVAKRSDASVRGLTQEDWHG